MKRLLYDIISKTVKTFSKGNIIGKDFNGLSKRLYYERAQHLTFLFQSKIKYEENIQSKIRPYLKEGDIVFDIGANIGWYSLSLASRYPKCEIHSFEPLGPIYNAFTRNLSLNSFANIHPNNVGLSNIKETVSFYYDANYCTKSSKENLS